MKRRCQALKKTFEKAAKNLLFYITSAHSIQYCSAEENRWSGLIIQFASFESSAGMVAVFSKCPHNNTSPLVFGAPVFSPAYVITVKEQMPQISPGLMEA